MNIGLAFTPQVAAFILTFILSLIAGPVLIPILRRLKFGQTVREDGPATHLKKTGTPNIGGLIFLLPMLAVSLVYRKDYPEITALIAATVGFGIVGFVDDYIKVVKKRKDGLYAGQKTVGLLAVAAAFSVYAAYFSPNATNIVIPFLGFDAVYTLPTWIFIPFTIFVLYSATNSVNMTDGVDGLAAGVTLIVAVFFTLVAMTVGEWDYLKIFSAITAGGCLGFLAFNTHPAKVFMGDTGSLSLGGAIGAVSVLMGVPWILVIAGGIYVIESLSVMIQVGYFKLTGGKRFFKMAPIHHHFELLGWKETKVVYVFWSVTVILCLISFLALRITLY